MWEKSLSLFKEMEEFGILQDEDCYSGAIWACVGGVKWQKAVELLKLMKFEGIECSTFLLLFYTVLSYNMFCYFILFLFYFILCYYTCGSFKIFANLIMRCSVKNCHIIHCCIMYYPIT